VRVVLMTAPGAPRELHLAARLAGVVACLAKPFRPETIAEALRLLAPRFALPAAPVPAR
jgi:CheY-like chemotaxis protein